MNKNVFNHKEVIYLLAFLISYVPSYGTETNEGINVAVNLSDGSMLIGKPDISSVTLQTSYAKIEIPINQILSIKIDDDRETAVLELESGDKLKGGLTIRALEIGTIFGKTSVSMEYIKNIMVRKGNGKGRILSTPLGKNLVLYYSFDRKEQGSVNDDSGNMHYGKVYGAEWIPRGKIGGAYAFDGIDDYIDVESSCKISESIGTDNFSAAGWLKTSAPSGKNYYILHQNISQSPYTGILLAIECNNFRFRADDSRGYSGSSMIFDVGNLLNGEEWHHFVAVRDNNMLYLYMDGVKKSEKKVPLANLDASYTAPLRIGGDCINNCHMFNGKMDEIMIWNRSLSEKEVNELYNTQK